MRYAIIENDKVTNIVAGDYEFLSTLFDDIVEFPETGVMPRIGARYNGEKFEPVQKHSKWIWNEELFEYEPPSPKPTGPYRWDDEVGDWVDWPVPFKGWTWSEEEDRYVPPHPHPEDGQYYRWDEETMDWVVLERKAEA